MKRHDNVDLWNYAAKGLQAEDARFTEEHLLDCPDCQATLERVRKAQTVLGTARFTQPRFELKKADAAIAKEISDRLLRQARPLRWRWVAAPLAVAVGALLGLAIQTWQEGQVVAPTEPAQVAALPEAMIHDGAHIEKSAELQQAGDVLTTGAKGHAWIRLPDTSRMKLAASSRLALSSVSPKSIDLQLDRGRVAVHAAHVPREAFTVRTGDVTVHVLGTTFAVSRGSDWVEVAVSEGRVGVESPRGLPFFVSAGERVRVGIKSWRPVSRSISGPLKDELKEVAPSTAPQAATPATGGKPAPAVQPVAARASSEAPLVVPLVVTPLEQPAAAAKGANEVPPDWAPMPNSRAPVGLRGIAEPNPPQPEVVAQAPAPAPAQTPAPVAAAPALAPTAVAQNKSAAEQAPAAAAPVAPPTNKATEPAPATALPAPAAEPAAPKTAPVAADPAPAAPPPPPPSAKAVPETRGPMPEDLEELFLMRAERALRNGGCDRYLLGLADIAEDPQKTVRQERARIAMARCQQALGQPEAAAQEFARYVRDFPKGLFAREATAAAAAQPAVAK